MTIRPMILLAATLLAGCGPDKWTCEKDGRSYPANRYSAFVGGSAIYEAYDHNGVLVVIDNRNSHEFVCRRNQP